MNKNFILILVVVILFSFSTFAIAGPPSEPPKPWQTTETVLWERPVGECRVQAFQEYPYIQCYNFDESLRWEVDSSGCDEVRLEGHKLSTLVCYEIE